MKTTADARAIPHDWRSRRPGSIVYGTWRAIFVVTRALFNAVRFIPSSLRQNTSWTYRQALMVEVMRDAMDSLTAVKMTMPLSLEPGAEGSRFVVMQPGPSELYAGPLAGSHPEGPGKPVRPAPIGGTWYPDTPPDDLGAEDGRIVLEFHSGGFLWATGRPADCAYSAGLLTSRLGKGTRAFFVQYRMPADPIDPTPFPGPIQDAVTAYRYLVVDRGVAPSRIVVAGDSAGGILALGLLRYLQDAVTSHGVTPELVPEPPLACLLFSPSVDLAMQGDASAVDAHPRARVDYLGGAMLAWGVSAFAPAPLRLDGPYLSPMHNPFSSPSPIWTQIGRSEIFCESVGEFHTEMFKQDRASHVIMRIHVTPLAPHNIFMVGNMLGWEKEAEELVDVAGRFLDEVQDKRGKP